MSSWCRPSRSSNRCSTICGTRSVAVAMWPWRAGRLRAACGGHGRSVGKGAIWRGMRHGVVFESHQHSCCGEKHTGLEEMKFWKYDFFLWLNMWVVLVYSTMIYYSPLPRLLHIITIIIITTYYPVLRIITRNDDDKDDCSSASDWHLTGRSWGEIGWPGSQNQAQRECIDL